MGEYPLPMMWETVLLSTNICRCALFFWSTTWNANEVPMSSAHASNRLMWGAVSPLELQPKSVHVKTARRMFAEIACANAGQFRPPVGIVSRQKIWPQKIKQ